jgi:deoxyhypusine synthase
MKEERDNSLNKINEINIKNENVNLVEDKSVNSVIKTINNKKEIENLHSIIRKMGKMFNKFKSNANGIENG